MKKSTKILSIILAIVMVLSAIPFFSFAASPSITLKANRTTVKAGDEVMVTVNLSADSNLGNIEIDLNYDKSAFEVISTSYDNLFEMREINQKLTGKVRFVAVNSTPVKKEGTLFTVSFRALKTADSEMKLSITEACDGDFNEVSITTNKLSFKGFVEEPTIEPSTEEPTTNYNTPYITLSADKKDIKAGDKVTVTASISANSGLGTLDADLVYDASAFKVTNMTASSDAVSGAIVNGNYAVGKARYTVATAGTIEKAGTLFTVELEALKAIDSKVYVAIDEACDDDYNMVNVSSNSIKFKGYNENTTEPTYPVSYSASSVSGYKGDIVTVKVYVDSNVNLWGANVSLGYDSNELEYVGSYRGDNASGGSLHNSGSSVNFSGTYAKNSGVVFYVEFRILMSHGTSILTLDSTENTGYDGEVFSCTTKNGVVRVITDEPTTEWPTEKPTEHYCSYSNYVVIKKATCKENGIMQRTCKICGDVIQEAIPATGKCEPGAWVVVKEPTTTSEGEKVQKCKYCGDVLQRAKIAKLPSDPINPDIPSVDDDYNFFIQEPSRTTIRNRDRIVLHVNPQLSLPKGSYIVWKYKNSNFDVEEAENGMKLIATAENKGWTVFTATLYDVDGNVLATDSVELYSKSGLFDKISGFFRKLFGATKIYEN